MLNSSDLEKVWSIIEPLRICTLHRVDGSSIISRPMVHLNSNLKDGCLYFLTAFSGEEDVEDYRQSSGAATYMDLSGSTYLTINGTFTTDNNKDFIKGLWNPMVEPWLPDGENTQGICAIKLKIERAEYWNMTENRLIRMFQLGWHEIINQDGPIEEHKVLQ